MQILANALPGFRDMRAPLTAGYMWLVFAWLLLRPNLDRRPSSEVAATLFDLGQDAGRIWVAIAVGTVAYLAGSVSLAVSGLLRGPKVVVRRPWTKPRANLDRLRYWLH